MQSTRIDIPSFKQFKRLQMNGVLHITSEWTPNSGISFLNSNKSNLIWQLFEKWKSIHQSRNLMSRDYTKIMRLPNIGAPITPTTRVHSIFTLYMWMRVRKRDWMRERGVGGNNRKMGARGRKRVKKRVKRCVHIYEWAAAGSSHGAQKKKRNKGLRERRGDELHCAAYRWGVEGIEVGVWR